MLIGWLLTTPLVWLIGTIIFGAILLDRLKSPDKTDDQKIAGAAILSLLFAVTAWWGLYFIL